MESLPNKLVLVGDRCIKNQSLRNQVNVSVNSSTNILTIISSRYSLSSKGCSENPFFYHNSFIYNLHDVYNTYNAYASI